MRRNRWAAMTTIAGLLLTTAAAPGDPPDDTGIMKAAADKLGLNPPPPANNPQPPQQQPQGQPQPRPQPPADPRLVGPLGDPALIDFTGDLPAPPDRLRFLLAGDLDVALASAADQPRADYLATLHDRLMAGLWSYGHPGPTVTVDADARPGRIAVHIDPGPVRREGPIRVTGDVDGLDTAALICQLTRPRPSWPFVVQGRADGFTLAPARGNATEPRVFWRGPDPIASFDPTNENYTSGQVLGALAELGYLDPRLSTEVTDDGTTATLEVDIHDLGRPATLSKLDVTGTAKNTPAAVIALTGLHIGQRLDMAQLQAAQQRLWDTGRFDRHTIAVRPADDGDPAHRAITIDVLEGDGPPLGQPFSPTEATLLRCREWMMSFVNGDRDLHLSGAWLLDSTGGRMTLSSAIGPRSGLAADVDLCGRLGGGDPRPIDLRVATALTADVAAEYLPNQHRRFALAAHGGFRRHLTLTARLEANADWPNPQHQRWTLNLNADVENVGDPALTTTLDVVLVPAYFVHVAHDPALAVRLHGHRLTITEANRSPARGPATEPATRPTTRPTGPSAAWVFDADTGAALGLDDLAGGHPLTVADTVRLHAGSVAVLAATLAHKHGDAPNDAIAADPLGSAVAFHAAQAVRVWAVVRGVPSDQADRAAAVVAKLLGPDVLAPLGPPGFGLVTTATYGLPRSPATGDVGGAAMLIDMLALPTNDHLFARNTWPWQIVRGVLLSSANRPAAALAVASGIDADGGPLAWLAIAEWVRLRAGSDAQSWARQGLLRMSAEQFDFDVADLFADGTGMAAFADPFVDAVRRLSPGEVDDLMAALPPGLADRVRPTIAAAKALAPLNGHQTAARLLARAWDHGLREAIDAELRRLAGP